MSKISRFAVEHPAIIGILLISLLFFGFISSRSITTSLMPALSMPHVYIISIYPGADAEDIENDVTKVIEDDMATLPSLKSISSKSGQSLSIVNIQFQDGVKPEDQIEDIRYRLSRLKDSLPADLQGDPWAVIATASMVECFAFSFYNADIDRSYEYLSREIVPRITQIKGVSSVVITPNTEKNIKVVLRLDDLDAKGINAIDVYKILSAGNKSVPLGETAYAARGVTLKYEGSYKSIEDFKNLTVGLTKDNIVIRLKDIADVISEPQEDVRNIIVNGKESFSVAIQKRDDGDIMHICRQIKSILNEVKNDFGQAVEIEVLHDDSQATWTTIKAVIISGLLGVIMAVISIWLCLADMKATLIIAISIPLCILSSIIALSVSGKSLNVMTLSGMVVALGMVVDGSIVMLEQVYRYLNNKKYTVKQSIIRGASEVAGSIFGSVATTVVVFIPIILLPGIVGLVLSDVALTLVYSMLASFIVSVVVVPFFLKVMRKENEKIKEHKLINNIFLKAEMVYKRILSWVLDNKRYVMSLSTTMLLISLLFALNLGFTFIPSVDQSNIFIEFKFPYTYSEDMTREESKRIINYLEGFEDLKNYKISITKGLSLLDVGGRNIVTCHVNFTPVDEREKRIQYMIPEIQSDLNSLFPDAEISVRNGGFDTLLSYAAEGSGYGISLVGEDMQLLYDEARRIKKALDEHQDVMSTRLSTTYDSRSVSFDMSHYDMSNLGVTSVEAGLTSALLFRQTDVGRFRNLNSNSRYKISITSDAKDSMIYRDVLDKIKVKSQIGDMVAFDKIGDFVESNSLTFINRKDRARNITIESGLVSSDLSKVTLYMNNYLKKNPLHEGVRRDSAGMMALIADSISTLITAVIIAIFLVYVVMVIQFERFIQPLIIMVCIPFTFIGVVLGLYIFGTPLSVMPILAIVALSGTVVNNGIILIDYTNSQIYKYRECKMRNLDFGILGEADCDITGSDYKDKYADKQWELALLRQQVVESCASRIKPIFMTVITTILGVVPMAFDKGEGSELYAPLGQAMFLGLFASTFISLVVIPILYYAVERRNIERKAPNLV